MPPKKAPGISFGTTKGVSDITMNYIFKPLQAQFKSYFVEFEGITAMKFKIIVFWNASGVVW